MFGSSSDSDGGGGGGGGRGGHGRYHGHTWRRGSFTEMFGRLSRSFAAAGAAATRSFGTASSASRSRPRTDSSSSRSTGGGTAQAHARSDPMRSLGHISGSGEVSAAGTVSASNSAQSSISCPKGQTVFGERNEREKLVGEAARRKERDRRTAAAMRAEKLKLRGNALFNKGKYSAAVEQYTYAITEFPREAFDGLDHNDDISFLNEGADTSKLSVYYSNRAMCNLNLHRFGNVLSDSVMALQLNKHNPKASYFLGLLFLHCHCSPDGKRVLDHWDPDPAACAPPLQSLEMAVTSLKHAEDAARRQGRSRALVFEYRKVANMARKHQWVLQQLQRQQELRLTLVQVKSSFRSAAKARLREARRKAKTKVHLESKETGGFEQREEKAGEGEGKSDGSIGGSDGPGNNDDDAIDDAELVYTDGERQALQLIEREIEDAAIKSRTREIPDFLLGKITFEPLLDPVCTPSGNSYERTTIEAHIRMNGPHDPLSRKPLPLQALTTNINLRDAVEAFIDRNPWAYDSGVPLAEMCTAKHVAVHASDGTYGSKTAVTVHFSTTVLRETLIRCGEISGKD